MSATIPCPACGVPRPADAPPGPCPACLLRLGLDGPDLSLSRSGPAATIDLAPGALATIAQTIGPVPRVLLRDTQPGEETSPVLGAAPADPTLRYRVDGEIARGGMGAVLKGRDPDLNREVALKVLRDDYRHDPTMVRRFVEEAQIGGQLQHPGIVPIYELGTLADRRPFFSMKLVKGQTLAQILAGRGAGASGRCQPPDAAERGRADGGPHATDGGPYATDQGVNAPRSPELPRLLAIFEAICQTVAYAHARGVIHRDLKPSNVMVGAFGEVQVMDWGLAKVLPRGGIVDDAAAGHVREPTVIATDRGDTDRSRAGSVMGTPAYMSPEQARGEMDRVDERTDVFALGSILCEILTGAPAFTGRSAGEIQARAARGDLAEALARLARATTAREGEAPAEPRASSKPRREDGSAGASPAPTPQSAIPDSLSDDLLALCIDCLAPERDARPRDAGAVAARVAAYLAGVQDRLRQAELDRAAADARATEERRKRRWQLGLVASIAGFTLLGATGLAVFASVVQSQKQALSRANADLSRANTALDQQRARAEDREQQAIDAVKRFRDAVADNPTLKNSPEHEDLRKTLLKEPLAFFKTLRDQLQADNDTRPEALARLAQAAFDLGDLTSEIGDRQDALRAHQEALAIRERLAAQNPSVIPIQRELADSHSALGILQSATGRPDDALASFVGALEIRERLARENPAVTELQRDLASSHTALGLLLSQTGRTDDALASYSRAIETFERLARENPSATELQRDLALSHNNLGVLQSQTGRHDDALASFSHALEIRERLARENPAVTKFQHDLALGYNNHGLLQSQAGRPDDALASYSRALEIRERLAREHPTVTEFQHDLAASHNNLGILQSETGRPDDALASYAHALEIRERLAREHPESLDQASGMGAILNNMARIDLDSQRWSHARTKLKQAITWQKKALAANPNHPTYRQFLKNHLTNLIKAANALGNDAEAAEAQRELAELNATDPTTPGSTRAAAQ